MAVAAGGYLGGGKIRALRRINLASGAQKLVHAGGPSFTGALGLAYHGVVVFSSARWARAYSGGTGRQLWRYAGALPDMIDAPADRRNPGPGHRGRLIRALRGPRGCRARHRPRRARQGLGV